MVPFLYLKSKNRFDFLQNHYFCLVSFKAATIDSLKDLGIVLAEISKLLNKTQANIYKTVSLTPTTSALTI